MTFRISAEARWPGRPPGKILRKSNPRYRSHTQRFGKAPAPLGDAGVSVERTWTRAPRRLSNRLQDPRPERAPGQILRKDKASNAKNPTDQLPEHPRRWATPVYMLKESKRYHQDFKAKRLAGPAPRDGAGISVGKGGNPRQGWRRVKFRRTRWK